MLTKFKISESPIKKPALKPWAATSPNMWVMRTGPETACLKSTPLNKRPKLLNVKTKLLWVKTKPFTILLKKPVPGISTLMFLIFSPRSIPFSVLIRFTVFVILFPSLKMPNSAVFSLIPLRARFKSIVFRLLP